MKVWDNSVKEQQLSKGDVYKNIVKGYCLDKGRSLKKEGKIPVPPVNKSTSTQTNSVYRKN